MNRNPATGEVFGVSVDLARVLAQELGVAAELVVFDAAAKSVDAVKAGQADIGFFAVDPLRSDGVRFSAPYVQIEGAYLVRNASGLSDNAQVDRAGTRVMVGKGSAYDLYLTRELKAATILRAPTSPAVVDSFIAENADVAAGAKQQLQADAARLPGLRLLPGRFMVIEQAMGVQANRGEAAQALLRAFVERAKASGFVARRCIPHSFGRQTTILSCCSPSRRTHDHHPSQLLQRGVFHLASDVRSVFGRQRPGPGRRQIHRHGVHHLDRAIGPLRPSAAGSQAGRGCGCAVAGAGHRAQGDADVVFMHDQVAEEKFLAEGFGLKRLPVMHNDFVVIGPKADPVGVDLAAAKPAGYKDCGMGLALPHYQSLSPRCNLASISCWNSGGP